MCRKEDKKLKVGGGPESRGNREWTVISKLNKTQTLEVKPEGGTEEPHCDQKKSVEKSVRGDQGIG